MVEELMKHKPLCYYTIKGDFVDEDKVVLERLDMALQQHYTPLFIRAKVENMRINKVLVDSGACINIIPHSMLRKLANSKQT